MNIALTAPYFHHGGMATLEEVVQFYNRGRDFNTAPGAPLNLSEDAQADLVAFLRNSLTDPRVLNEQAPFDATRKSLSPTVTRVTTRALRPGVAKTGHRRRPTNSSKFLPRGPPM